MSAPRDDRKYSRVYHEAVDDPKFCDVWGDDARLALWVRLLVLADQAWPASATLPRSVKRRPLLALVTVGLVDLGTGDQFRIHGLDRERQRRSDLAAYAAQVRWDADRNADSTARRNAVSMPRRDEHRKEEKRVDKDVDLQNGARALTPLDLQREARRIEALELHERFKRHEITEAQYERLRQDIGKEPDDLTRVTFEEPA